MTTANNIIKDIKNKKYAPIYFLMGEEPFFIEQISKVIENEVLTEEEKAFNQNILYGNDVEMIDVVGMARQYPMGAERQVIIVKEAQHLFKDLEPLIPYAENPQPSTILVFNYKGKKLDGRSKLFKILKKNSVIPEFKRVYEDRLPQWIDTTARSMGLIPDNKSLYMMVEFMGADLETIYNELLKLKIVAKDGKITPELIERNIGISKDYNNFELQSAIEKRDAARAFRIAQHFKQNSKDNPLVVTLAVLYRAFSNIIILHTLTDKSPKNISAELGINPYFVSDALTAARNYPLKKATRAISLLREADVKSKGIGATGNVPDGDLLRELIFKIFSL